MTPIVLNLRVGRLPAASTPVGGELSAEQVDGNFTALKSAAEQLDAEKLNADAATPVTLRATSVTATDDVILLRGGVPYLVAATVLASYFGSAPAATAPAAMTAGQWTATAGTTSVVINITALPSDGGSAITALQYRFGTGAAVALTGTGTGSRTISGLAGDVAIDLQVRAVNAVGAGDWSDTKTRTPTAAVGGGGAAYVTQAVFGGLNTIAVTIPGGVTATDTLFALCAPADTDADSTALTTMAVSGWTSEDTVTQGDVNARLFSAPGDVGTLTFSASGLRSVVLVAVRGSRRASALAARYYAHEGDVHTTPSATAVDGDLVVSVYVQGDGPNPGHGTNIQAGYTREYLKNDAAPWVSVLSRENAPAGSTGVISHDGGAGYSTRTVLTLVVQP